MTSDQASALDKTAPHRATRRSASPSSLASKANVMEAFDECSQEVHVYHTYTTRQSRYHFLQQTRDSDRAVSKSSCRC